MLARVDITQLARRKAPAGMAGCDGIMARVNAAQCHLHPVQVALQVSLPEIDGAIEPVIFAGREGATGRSVPLTDRIDLLANRAGISTVSAPCCFWWLSLPSALA